MSIGWFSAFTTDPRSIHMMLSPAHAEVVDEYLADLAASLEEVRAGQGTAAAARYS